MRTIIQSLKRHLLEYYLFYILAYALALPIWLELVRMFLTKNIDVAFSLIVFILGSMVILAAGILKHNFPKLSLLSKILLFVGLGVEVIFLSQLLKPLLSETAVAVPGLVSMAVSVWWIVIYCLDLSGINRERNRLLGKKMLRYLIVTAALLYIPFIMLSRYYRRQIDAVVAAGSVNVPGGMDYRQIEMMMDEKLWQAKALVSLLIILALIVFFCFYRRVKNRY